MQVLDQEVAPALAVAKQRPHLVERLRVDLTALGRFRRPAASAGGLVGKNVHAQNNPTIFPSGPTSMASAAGTLGRPGMVMISPQIATTNSAPADSRTSRTLMV